MDELIKWISAAPVTRSFTVEYFATGEDDPFYRLTLRDSPKGRVPRSLSADGPTPTYHASMLVRDANRWV